MKTNYFLKQSTKKVIFMVFIIPIILQLVIINFVQMVVDEMLYYILFILFWLMYLPYFYWLNITVSFLYAQPNKYFNIDLKIFKISLLINSLIILNFVFFTAYIFSFLFKGGKPNTEIFLYVLFVQCIGIMSFIYSTYFVCKLISTIELKRKIYFTDVIGNLVTLLIPPIAVWIIHNKVKEIIENTSNHKQQP